MDIDWSATASPATSEGSAKKRKVGIDELTWYFWKSGPIAVVEFLLAYVHGSGVHVYISLKCLGS